MDLNDDIVIACVDLVGRTGAKGFEIGHNDGHPARWHASAMYRGARVTSDEHASPTAAALGLAERLLSGALCRCGRPVTLSDSRALAGRLEGCRWRLLGKRWEPGCDAPPMNAAQAEKIRRQQR